MKFHFAALRLFIPLIPIVVLTQWQEIFGESDAWDTRSEEFAGVSTFSQDPLLNGILWDRYLDGRPAMEPYRDVFSQLSEHLPLERFQALTPEMQARLASFAERKLSSNSPSISMCWEPGVDPEIIATFHSVEEMGDVPGEPQAATQFDENDRWARTATFNSFFEFREQGKPTTLTWSFMPDGTSIFGFNSEPTADSDLVSFLDARYGVTNGGSDLTTRPWFSVFEAAFDNIASMTGITYVYEPDDDGASLTQNSNPSGSLGNRGDIRIGGHFIDGEAGSNTLAYNFSPSSGDMVIDTGNVSFYGNTSSDSLNLRNVVEHEHCHGLALGHVCPITQTKLMEPFISRQFRGLQLDDVFSLNRLYGDFYEKHNSSRNNDSVGNAAPLDVSVGSSFSKEHLSIDDNNDTDFYRLDDVPSGTLVTFRVVPVSTPTNFVEGPQNSDGSCSAGSSFDFTNIHDLDIAIFSASGNTLFAEATSEPQGESEEITAFELPSTADYILRVTGDSSNDTQLYTLELELFAPPAPPENLVASSAISGEVSLTWDDLSDNENGFRIQRKLERDGTWTPIGAVGANMTTFIDNSPVTGTNLYYYVETLNGQGNSEPSDEEIIMVVDLAAESYLYDFGGTLSPLAAGALRISRQTDGDVSWSAAVTSRDRGGADSFNRDHLFADSARTWSHRISNGVWEVTVRQGDEDSAREELSISAEGVLQASGIASAVNEFVETQFTVNVIDESLDLIFDDSGGASNRWVVNRILLKQLSPYRSWAFLENLPDASDGPLQDADADGVSNVQEYYFGRSPLVPEPRISISVSQDSVMDRVMFVFLRDHNAQTDTAIYEKSSDLENWAPFVPLPSEITVTRQGEFEKVTLSLTKDTTRKFIRVGVSLTE